MEKWRKLSQPTNGQISEFGVTDIQTKSTNNHIHSKQVDDFSNYIPYKILSQNQFCQQAQGSCPWSCWPWMGERDHYNQSINLYILWSSSRFLETSESNDQIMKWNIKVHDQVFFLVLGWVTHGIFCVGPCPLDLGFGIGYWGQALTINWSVTGVIP